MAQSFEDFEVLVMDDGSNDNTGEVVRSYNDPRIHYEWSSNSGGPATPRNRGIESARADWICFLDADDRWYRDKLKTVAEVIAANSALDLVCHHEILSVLATGSKTQLNHGPFETDFYRVMLMLGNRVSTSAVTVRRAFLNKHGLRFNQSQDYVIVEDYDLWLRIALHDGAFYFISDYLGEYVIADDNLSSNSQRMQHNHLALLHDHVYNVQSFRPDKDRLWREIRAGLLIAKSRQLFAERRLIAGVKPLMLAFCGSFVGATRYIFLQALKKRIASGPRSNRDYKRSGLCRSR